MTNEGTVWATAAQGFAGPVAVQVTLDGLTIKSIKIGDSQFAETDGLGANALDPLFQLQFVDKTLPLAEGDVEAISGATITTDAVLEALSAIYDAASAETAVIGSADGPTEIDVTSRKPPRSPRPPTRLRIPPRGESSTRAPSGPPPRRASPAPSPCRSPLTASPSSPSRSATSQFAETDGLGANALDPMFQLQFVDKTLPLAEGDVEAISGATITTDAVLSALNAIYEAASAETAVIGGADGPTD